jgi:hypothetical protein
VSWEGVGMQPLRTLPKTVEADYYNRIRLAVLRTTTPPLRFIPRNMPLLEVLLEDHQWLCLDGAFTGLPLLQWTDFQTQRRTGLQEPVRCVLHLYQPQAGLLMGRALEAINAHLKAAETPPFSG